MTTKNKTPVLLNTQLKVKRNKVTTTSQEIAEVFGKQHSHVLRTIEGLECNKEFTQSNFGLSECKDASGKQNKVYNITKDGFLFLAMGFTGKKAAQFKVAYINAFNAMEKRLQLKISHKEQEVPLNYFMDEAFMSTVDLALIFDKDIADLNKQADIIKDDSKLYNRLHIIVKTYNYNPPRRMLNKEAFLLMNFGNSQEVANQKLRILSAINNYNELDDGECCLNKVEAKNELLEMHEKLKKQFTN